MDIRLGQPVAEPAVAPRNVAQIGKGRGDHGAVGAGPELDLMDHGGRHHHQRGRLDHEAPVLDPDRAALAIDQQELDVVGMRMGADRPIVGAAPFADRFDMKEVQLHILKPISVKEITGYVGLAIVRHGGSPRFGAPPPGARSYRIVQGMSADVHSGSGPRAVFTAARGRILWPVS